MLTLIDNYDSFTFNLRNSSGIGRRRNVVRNDKTTPRRFSRKSPKPSLSRPARRPDRAGICLAYPRSPAEFADFQRMLNHQCIGQAFGGEIVRANIMHGKLSDISHGSAHVFRPARTAHRDALSFADGCAGLRPDCLEVTAQTSDGVIMGRATCGPARLRRAVSPESIASQAGTRFLPIF